MERDEFAKRAMAAVCRAHPAESFELDAGAFKIRRKGKDGALFDTFLQNYYAEHEHAGEDGKARVFERLARQALLIDSKESLDEVRVSLRPRVRPRRTFELDLRRQGEGIGAKKLEIAYRPLADHLGVGVAIDRPEHIDYVLDPPARFKATFDELYDMALVNLRAATKGGLTSTGAGTWAGTWDDGYAAERLLLPVVFEGLETRGDLVVFAPGAEVILAVDTADADAVRRTLARVRGRMKEPRALVDLALVRRGDGWAPYAGADDLGRWNAERIPAHLAEPYVAQKAAFESRGEADGVPLAPLLRVSTKDPVVSEGDVLGTLWIKGLTALLPQVHVLGLARGKEDEPIFARWSDVLEVAGDLLEPVPDLYPPRWKPRAFPNVDALDKLAPRSIRVEKREPPARAAVSGKAAVPAKPAGSSVAGHAAAPAADRSPQLGALVASADYQAGGKGALVFVILLFVGLGITAMSCGSTGGGAALFVPAAWLTWLGVRSRPKPGLDVYERGVRVRKNAGIAGPPIEEIAFDQIRGATWETTQSHGTTWSKVRLTVAGRVVGVDIAHPTGDPAVERVRKALEAASGKGARSKKAHGVS
jgi:hypothetical protein